MNFVLLCKKRSTRDIVNTTFAAFSPCVSIAIMIITPLIGFGPVGERVAITAARAASIDWFTPEWVGGLTSSLGSIICVPSHNVVVHRTSKPDIE